MEKANKPNFFPVIVIEDDVDLLQLYKDILSTVTPTESLMLYDNGHDGLEAIKTFSPSLIITDLNLPEIDGLEIIAQWEKLHPNTPLIVISGFFALDSVKDITSHLSQITFLSKPFDLDLFKKLVHSILKERADSRIKGISITNLIQLIAAEEKNAHLEIHYNSNIGWISIRSGTPHYAKTASSHGIAAIREINSWHQPIIMMHDDLRISSNNIKETSAESVILELCRTIDESMTMNGN